MDEYAVVHAWLNQKVATGEMKPIDAQERMRAYESDAKSWTSPLKDGFGNVRLIYQLSRDMQTLWGRVYFKTYKGVEYVIIKGRPALRDIIKGTRYKTTHPKIVEFQIGKVGLKSAARDSFIFGAIFVTAIDITDYFMRDSATLGDLVGSVGMDIAKVAVASAAGYAIGALAVGTVIGTVALGPLVVAFGAAVLVGIALDALDEHFELTKRLSRALDQVFDKIDKFFQEKEAEAKAWLHKIQTSPTMVDLSQSVESWWSGATSWFTRVNWSYGTANTFYGI
jgi:hypothetical protein